MDPITHCDLCGVVLARYESIKVGRCVMCRKRDGEPVREPLAKVKLARIIINSCGECPSCECGHPERCDRCKRDA